MDPKVSPPRLFSGLALPFASLYGVFSRRSSSHSHFYNLYSLDFLVFPLSLIQFTNPSRSFRHSWYFGISLPQPLSSRFVRLETPDIFVLRRRCASDLVE